MSTPLIIELDSSKKIILEYGSSNNAYLSSKD